MPAHYLYAHDFLYYWAAARLLIAGGDPYDTAALNALLTANGFSDFLVWEFQYPPWTLSLFLPFGLLPFEAARLAWVGMLALTTALTMREIRALVPEPSLQRGSGTLPPALGTVRDLLTFTPLFFVFFWGQPAPLSAWCALRGVRAMREGRSHRMMIWLTLSAIKPQLLSALYACALGRLCARRHWTPLISAAGVVIGLMIPALILNGDLFASYLRHIPHFIDRAGLLPLSTLPMLLGIPLDSRLIGALALSAALVGAALGLRQRAGRLLPDILFLICFSLTVAPYAWSHSYFFLIAPWFATVLPLMRPCPWRMAGLVALAAAVLWGSFGGQYSEPPFIIAAAALTVYYLPATSFFEKRRSI